MAKTKTRIPFKMITTMAVVLGGSSEDSRERTPLASVELFTFNLPNSPKNCEFRRMLLPNLCIPRRSPALFKFQCQHLFVLGGCSGPGEHLSNAELFDLENGEKWKLLENQIHPFSCAAFCQFDDGGPGFVFGGFDGQNCLCQVLKIEKEEPHRIQTLNKLPFGLKNSTALAAKNSQKIWLIGGWDGRRTLTTILEYDLATQNCEIRRLLPFPLEGHSIGISKTTEFAFICGGFDGTGLRHTILVMDQNTGEIVGTAEASLATARENSVAFCVNDGREEWMAILGGWDGQKALSDVEMFKILPGHPFLRREENFGNNFELQFARNRPAAVTF